MLSYQTEGCPLCTEDNTVIITTLSLRLVFCGSHGEGCCHYGSISFAGSGSLGIWSESASETDSTLLWTRVLVMSCILDHSSCRASQCIETVLTKRRGTGSVETIHLLSDAGPHFRSYEALHHATVVMPAKHGCRVVVHWGCEKNFKSKADRLFALFERMVKEAKQQQKGLIEISDLHKYLQDSADNRRRQDPTSPFLCVIDDSSAQKKPAGERFALNIKNFHVTRTYCQ